MFVLLGEVIGFSLKTLGFRLVNDTLHFACLAVAVSIVHFQLIQIIMSVDRGFGVLGFWGL